MLNLGAEFVELHACLREHFGLHIELLARDEIEPRKGGLEHRAEVLFHFLAQRPEPFRQAPGQATGEVVYGLGINHGASLTQLESNAHHFGAPGAAAPRSEWRKPMICRDTRPLAQDVQNTRIDKTELAFRCACLRAPPVPGWRSP